MILVVDGEFESLIPALQPEQFEALRENILRAGRILDPIKVWEAPDGSCDTIIDGHNRYRIYRSTNPRLPEPAIERIALPDRESVKDWMRENQRGRRNLSPDQQIMLDVQAGIKTPGGGIKTSQAVFLLTAAPAAVDDVISGRKSIGQAFKDVRSKAANDPASPTPLKPLAKTRATRLSKGRIHVVIGDTQVKPDVPTDHLRWIGQYIADKFTGQNVAIIHLGDHWDMPSLSSYDQGKKAIEGRRYVEDIKAGNDAFAVLNEPIKRAMASGRWKPERHFLMGNHEDRITRSCNDVAMLDGKLTLADCDTQGWTVHKFREILALDGIDYSHFFYHPKTGRPYGGENIQTRLKTIGRSFTQGHVQGVDYGLRPVGTRRHHGLILGSSYIHEEDYLGPQVTSYWRGIVVKYHVEDGMYDPKFVSLDSLCRRYENKTLEQYMRELRAREVT